MESLCDAVTKWCVEFIYGNDKAGNLAIGNWEQFTARGNRIYSFLMIGGVIGVFMNHFSFLHKNLRPLIMGIQTLPSICWVPFSILWFGLTQTAIIFVVIMGSAFSMAIAVDNAILNVPPIYKKQRLQWGQIKNRSIGKLYFPQVFRN